MKDGSKSLGKDAKNEVAHASKKLEKAVSAKPKMHSSVLKVFGKPGRKGERLKEDTLECEKPVSPIMGRYHAYQAELKDKSADALGDSKQEDDLIFAHHISTEKKLVSFLCSKGLDTDVSTWFPSYLKEEFAKFKHMYVKGGRKVSINTICFLCCVCSFSLFDVFVCVS